MATKQLEAVETPLSQRKTKLGAVIKRINGNLRDSFLSTINTGIDLDVIQTDQLYKEHNHESFKDFVDSEYVGLFDYKQAKSWIQIAKRYQAILAYKPEETEVPLPTAISQIRPLLSYAPDEAAPIYWDAATLLFKSTGRVTGEGIDKFRTGAIDITPVEPVSRRAPQPEADTNGDEPSDLDFSDAVATGEVKTRTLAATEALEKIGVLAAEGVLPPDSRSAIENDLIRVPEAHLEQWNECDPEQFKKIARLVFGAALAYDKAIAVLAEPMSERSSLLNFVYLSIASGGKGSVTFRGYVVSAEPVKKE